MEVGEQITIIYLLTHKRHIDERNSYRQRTELEKLKTEIYGGIEIPWLHLNTYMHEFAQRYSTHCLYISSKYVYIYALSKYTSSLNK